MKIGLAVGLSLLFCLGCSARTTVYDVSGAAVDPLAEHEKTVLVFVATECPISNQYAPALRAFAKTFSARGVRFWLVYPSQLDTSAKIRAHLASFDFGMRALRDPEHSLVRYTGATVTPSVAVLREDGSLAYLGRIDNRYEAFGVARPAATRSDLELALGTLFSGKAISPARTAAVGCAIAD